MRLLALPLVEQASVRFKFLKVSVVLGHDWV